MSQHPTRMARIGKHWTGKKLALKRRGATWYAKLTQYKHTHIGNTPSLTLKKGHSHANTHTYTRTCPHTHTHTHTQSTRHRHREKCLWSMSDFCSTLFQMPIFNEGQRREKMWPDLNRLAADISSNGTFLVSTVFKYQLSFWPKE